MRERTLLLSADSRHTIYRMALSKIISDSPLSADCCCDAIFETVIDLGYSTHGETKASWILVMESFPELYDLKPKGKLDGGHWWESGDMKIREGKLQICIDQTA